MIVSDAKKVAAREAYLLTWRRWFAWHPVRTRDNNNTVWLQHVERSSRFVGACDGTYCFTDYRSVGSDWGNER